MYYVYCILNNVNKKTYIGERKCPKSLMPEADIKYMGSGLLITKAYKKYNLSDFSKSILAVTGIKQNADILEKFFISLYKKEGKAEYNIADGGQGGDLGVECRKRISEKLKGHPVSEETRKKFSEQRKGRRSGNKGKKMSEEAKLKMSLAHKGKVGHGFSEETRKRISEKLKGHPVSEETRRKISINTKLAMTEDVCKRISEKNFLRFQKLEERQKLSIAHKGKKISEEHKRKISEGLKRRYR